ncbi:MAG: hypothetical protein ABW000_14170 [Actinoplanes sp.]
MAIPFLAVEQFGKLRPDWTGKTVVDTTNAYYAPGSTEILQGRPSAQYNAELLPHALVLRNFIERPLH